MKSRRRAILTVIAILHWIFYGFWIIPIILNPEMWFFGEKFSGDAAVAIHLAIGFSGMAVGCMIYQNNKIACLASIPLFAAVLSSTLVNHMSCWEFDLYCN